MGKTARHGTYFEMLGNFSFGDYFKEEATAWAWEFLTQVLEMPVDRLWVSIYEDDDEAFDIWTKQVGVDPRPHCPPGQRGQLLGASVPAPAAPAPKSILTAARNTAAASPTAASAATATAIWRFWNLVFSQFDSDGEGHYEPLEHPNIDTGMGLERLACVMQGVDNLFEVDTVQNIMKHISSHCRRSLRRKRQGAISLCGSSPTISAAPPLWWATASFPPTRAAAMCCAACCAGPPVMAACWESTILSCIRYAKRSSHENASAYPELVEKKDYIIKVHPGGGRALLPKPSIRAWKSSTALWIKSAPTRSSRPCSPARMRSSLYDTFGFPIDLTREILAERGLPIDEEGFFTADGRAEETRP